MVSRIGPDRLHRRRERRGPIAVVHADGTGQRVIAGGSFARYFDWWPDGSWLVAWDSAGQRLDIVSADSGLMLPLDYASYAASPTILPSTSPTWQPIPTSGSAAHVRSWRRPSKSAVPVWAGGANRNRR